MHTALRSSQQGLLPVPFARTSTKQIRAFSVVGSQPGTASLLNFAFLTEPLHLRFFLTLRLLCLTVLVLWALLSSFLEEALYKCSIWMNEWMNESTSGFPRWLKYTTFYFVIENHKSIKILFIKVKVDHNNPYADNTPLNHYCFQVAITSSQSLLWLFGIDAIKPSKTSS